MFRSLEHCILVLTTFVRTQLRSKVSKSNNWLRTVKKFVRIWLNKYRKIDTCLRIRPLSVAKYCYSIDGIAGWTKPEKFNLNIIIYSNPKREDTRTTDRKGSYLQRKGKLKICKYPNTAKTSLTLAMSENCRWVRWSAWGFKLKRGTIRVSTDWKMNRLAEFSGSSNPWAPSEPKINAAAKTFPSAAPPSINLLPWPDIFNAFSILKRHEKF